MEKIKFSKMKIYFQTIGSTVSTVTQLLYFLEKCCKALTKGWVVDTIYFDFAKAFDTVPHRRLIEKLEGYGIKGAVLTWIRSFLTNGKQLIK